MSSRWLREIPCEGGTQAGASIASAMWFAKAIALWLNKVMDYTLQDELAAGGRSWVSTERSGTGGSFSGSSFQFTGPSSSFLASDKDKYLIVKDDTNPRNGGIYRIVRRVSDTVIEIDYRAGTLEFPVAVTGLSWWICGANYQLPQTNGDYVHLQSRHATGWAVEFKWNVWPGGYSWTHNLFLVRVAVNGSWGGPIIGNFIYSAPMAVPAVQYNTGFDTPPYGYSEGAWMGLFFCEGDYDGEWLHLIMTIPKPTAAGEGFATQMIEIARLTPVEPGLPDDDLIVLKGGGAQAGTQADLGTRLFDNNYSAGYAYTGRSLSWNTEHQREDYSWCVDYSYAGYQAAFGRMPSREANRRRGERLEAVRGSLLVVDPGNYFGYFRILGYDMGHWVIPMLPSHYSASFTLDMSSTRYCHRMTPLNMNGDRDALLVNAEMVIPWCGLSLIGQGVIPRSLP